MTLMKLEQLDEATSHLAIAQAFAPDDYRTSLGLGTIRQERGQISEAKAEFEKVLALQPEEPFALNNLGILARARG